MSHSPHVFYSLNHISGSCLAFRLDHCRAFAYSSQCLAQIVTAAHEWNLERSLINMERIVGRCEDFAFVDIIDINSLHDLALDEVANARLGHDSYCYSGLNLFDH